MSTSLAARGGAALCRPDGAETRRGSWIETRGLLVGLLRRLLRGVAVNVDELAGGADVPARVVERFVERLGSGRDDEWRFVGLGITLNPTRHGYEVEDHELGLTDRSIGQTVEGERVAPFASSGTSLTDPPD